MSDKPAWMETWIMWSYEGPSNGVRHDRHGASVCVGDLADEGRDDEIHECIATVTSAVSQDGAVSRARLAAAAPAMVRALLAVEWEGIRVDTHTPSCPECGGQPRNMYVVPHFGGCLIDSALTAAGFPDHQSRDAARALIAEKP